MATQTTYADAQPIGTVGALANSEAWNALTRTAAGTIPFASPVFRSAARTVTIADEPAKTAAGAAGVPAPAAATITAAPTAASNTKVGVHTFTAIVGGATTASKWRHEDPDGIAIGTATGNTAYAGGGISGLTITDAGTDPVVGETFTVTVTSDAAGAFLGIAIRDINVIHTTPDQYEIYDNVKVMEWGVMFVTAGATVTAGQQAYWDDATGKYTNTVTDYLIPGGTFDSDAVDAGIVKLRLRVSA